LVGGYADILSLQHGPECEDALVIAKARSYRGNCVFLEHHLKRQDRHSCPEQEFKLCRRHSGVGCSDRSSLCRKINDDRTIFESPPHGRAIGVGVRCMWHNGQCLNMILFQMDPQLFIKGGTLFQQIHHRPSTQQFLKPT
jgi:hypothetical protein